MSIDLTHVAREAAEWFNDHEWVQGQWGDSEKGCLHQAVRVCDPQPGDGYIVSAVLTHLGYSTGWNDTAGRTRDEVLAVLASVSVTDAELEATFGPNWRGVVSVVRQSAALTPEQAQELDAARYAAWYAARHAAWAFARYAARDAARDAAWDAARDAAWDAALDAALDAAWDAAWAAARDAAWGAALATVARDLITVEQYDILTGPWVSVVGPIEDAA
jgi:hypothetical protein